MRRRFARGPGLVLAAGLSLVLASCGERGEKLEETGATLEGTVKHGNEPLQFALVIAVGGGKSASGKIGEDGRYKIENCPTGEVKLAVNTEAGRGDYMSAMMSGSYQGPEAKGAKKTALRFVEVPKKFHDPETTTLKTNVVKGANTFDIVVPK